jgi:hypothetical protein
MSAPSKNLQIGAGGLRAKGHATRFSQVQQLLTASLREDYLNQVQRDFLSRSHNFM